MRHLTLVSVVCALVLSFAGRICVAQETTDEIIKKVQKANDPQDKCKSIKTQIISSKIKTFDGKDGDLSVKLKKPGKIRIEIIAPDFTAVRICDGKKGWEFSSKDGLREITGKELGTLRFQALYLEPDSNLGDIFTKITLDGEVEFAGQKCYKLKCESAPEYNSQRVTFFVDKETYLVLKSEEKHNTKDESFDLVTVYEDYTDTDGILVPMTIISELDGKIRDLKIDSIKWNEDLPDSDFEAPKALGK